MPGTQIALHPLGFIDDPIPKGAVVGARSERQHGRALQMRSGAIELQEDRPVRAA